MKNNNHILFSMVLGITLMTLVSVCSGQNRRFPTETVDLKFPGSSELPSADETAKSIVLAAEAFLDLLTDAQRDAVVYSFDDNQQRARWSNLPVGLVQRGGIFRGDLNEDQIAGLDALLTEVLSDEGLRNANLQIAADDTLPDNSGRLKFGSDYYYIAFLGEPALDALWTLQFGGHHLAINTTFAGSQASFSPMLTGGQPITFEYQGEQVNITRQETEAAQAFLDSLDGGQKAKAVQSGEAIQFLLGPGEHGTSLALEGVRGADLTAAQQELMLAVVEARIGHFHTRDAEAKMAAVRARIDDTYFGWWGPEGMPGAAYFRITGPEIVLEYSPRRWVAILPSTSIIFIAIPPMITGRPGWNPRNETRRTCCHVITYRVILCRSPPTYDS